MSSLDQSKRSLSECWWEFSDLWYLFFLSALHPWETMHSQYPALTKFFTGAHFSPDNDIPNLSGKVIAITGGNANMGKEIVKELAKHSPADIYLLARNDEAATVTISSIRKEVPKASITHIHCDLTSFTSIAHAAKALGFRTSRLDVLINHAAVMAVGPDLTTEGHELQFGTNHIGHHLLTKILLPILKSTPSARVVNVSSIAHAIAPFPEGILFPSLTTTAADLGTWTRYGQSKLANILFTQELGRRHPSIVAVAVHPGFVNTSLFTENSHANLWCMWMCRLAPWVFMSETSYGAANCLWAATTPEPLKSGAYYGPVGRETAAEYATNEIAEKLWEWTDCELQKKGY